MKAYNKVLVKITLIPTTEIVTESVEGTIFIDQVDKWAE